MTMKVVSPASASVRMFVPCSRNLKNRSIAVPPVRNDRASVAMRLHHRLRSPWSGRASPTAARRNEPHPAPVCPRYAHALYQEPLGSGGYRKEEISAILPADLGHTPHSVALALGDAMAPGLAPDTA